MKPEEWRRRRARGKVAKAVKAKARAKNAPSELESFRASLPDVEPVRVTEAAAYYFDESKGWWFDSACPIHPKTQGPFSSLEEAMIVGERGCMPCEDLDCKARIASSSGIRSLEVISPGKPAPRALGKARVVDLKARPRPAPRRDREDGRGSAIT